MTELAIATHLTTSARMVMRPIFKEIDIFEQALKSEERVILQSISVRVSFDHKDRSFNMACYCVMRNVIGSGDWQPDFAQLFDTEGEAGGNELKIFRFNQTGHISE